jgi:hypothetical protein
MQNYDDFFERFIERTLDIVNCNFDKEYDDEDDYLDDLFADSCDDNDNTDDLDDENCPNIVINKEWQEGSVIRREFIEESDELPDGLNWGQFVDYMLTYKVPKGYHLVKDKIKSKQVLQDVNEFMHDVWDFDEDATLKIEQCEFDGTSLCATIVCCGLPDETFAKLRQLSSTASSCELNALLTCNIEITLTFSDVFLEVKNLK